MMLAPLSAHAKLNLGLRVFPARADGFHDIETWMVRISWHDTVTVEDSPTLQLVVTGRAEGVPTEIEKNLVGRAAVALAHAAGMLPRGRIVLEKVLPPGGGIGGGSSDAAAALLALNQAWGLHWELPRLQAVAATLGSDIPFFIQGHASLCTGRGEIMSPLPLRHPLFAVLLIPPVGCPTKDVYQAFDLGLRHEPAFPPTDWNSCAAAPADELAELLINDLEPAAFAVAPSLPPLRDRAAELLNRRVHLTGSGSTLFALYESKTQADAGAALCNAELDQAAHAVSVQILP